MSVDVAAHLPHSCSFCLHISCVFEMHAALPREENECRWKTKPDFGADIFLFCYAFDIDIDVDIVHFS